MTWLTYGAMLLLGINVGWLGPFLPQISHAIRSSLDDTGLILSAIAAGYFIALPAGGELAHRRGAHLVLTLAMALDAAGFFALAMAPNLALSLCAAGIVGVGQCGIDIAANTLVAELNRDRLASALNYLHLMFGVGATLGPAIDALALGSGVSYAATFGCGAAAIGATAAVLAITPASARRSDPTAALDLRSMLSQRLIWALALVLFLYVGAEVGVGAWLFTYLRIGHPAFGSATASLGVSVYWGGLICGRLIGGRLGHRVNARRLAAIGSLLAAACLAGMIAIPSGSRLAFVLILLLGVGYGPIFPNMIAIGAQKFPSRVASMTAVVAGGAALGGVLLPWAMGVALTIGGRGASIGLALAATIAMLATVAALNRGARPAAV